MSREKRTKFETNKMYGQKAEHSHRSAKNTITTKLQSILSKYKEIPNDLFDLWDKASIQKVIELHRKTEIEALRLEVAQFMSLVGTHYGIEKHIFWKRFHTSKKVKRDG